MGNKTIYFRDDDLWDRAKELAGPEGISRVIQDALAKFVDDKMRQAEGFRTYRVKAQFKGSEDEGGWEATERIAFEGRRLASVRMQGPVREGDTGLYSAEFTVYRTKGGKLVLSTDDIRGQGLAHYGVYTSLRELAEDPELEGADPIERAKFLDIVSNKLTEDWATWID